MVGLPLLFELVNSLSPYRLYVTILSARMCARVCMCNKNTGADFFRVTNNVIKWFKKII